jgi:catechol 2,3-dioxygenase-like lactoylglutathione lyase family enzyme
MAGRVRLFRLLLMATLIAAGGAGTAYAHQPYLVNDTVVTRVDKPEVSKAFYAKLLGEPAVYEIVSPDSFELYVNILVPDEVGMPTDLSVTVTRGPDTLAVLDGPAHGWTRFYEPFGGDSYLMGPERRLRIGPGTYFATVTRPGNTGRYVLAVGEREQFSLKDVARLFSVMPRLKRDFFGKAPIRALFDPIFSPFRRRE